MWVCVHLIVSVEILLKCFSPGSYEAASSPLTGLCGIIMSSVH